MTYPSDKGSWVFHALVNSHTYPSDKGSCDIITIIPHDAGNVLDLHLTAWPFGDSVRVRKGGEKMTKQESKRISAQYRKICKRIDSHNRRLVKVCQRLDKLMKR